MKILTTILFSLISIVCFSQVSGEIAIDNRKITNDIDYTVKSSKTGTIVFKISVNEKGDVTGCVFDKASSTIYSTTLMVKSKNLILRELKFESGSRYPQFHQGIVTITVESN